MAEQHTPTTEEKQAQETYTNATAMKKAFGDTGSFFGRVFLTTAIPLLILAGIGLVLDNMFHTGHMFLIIGCLLAFIAGQVLTIYVFRNLTK